MSNPGAGEISDRLMSEILQAADLLYEIGLNLLEEGQNPRNILRTVGDLYEIIGDTDQARLMYERNREAVLRYQGLASAEAYQGTSHVGSSREHTEVPPSHIEVPREYTSAFELRSPQSSPKDSQPGLLQRIFFGNSSSSSSDRASSSKNHSE